MLNGFNALGMSTLALDVTDPESIQACHKRVGEITGGRLHFLVNNAYVILCSGPTPLHHIITDPKWLRSGARFVMPALDVDLDQARAMFETNVFGIMAMVSTFSDQLIAVQGLIINICSTAAVAPYVFSSTYCATKGALASYSRTLRQELRPFGVRVMVVMAGTIKSTQSAKKDLPEDSLYKPIEDVFLWRQGFSQQHAKISAEEFAGRLVGNVLAAETPGWLPFLRNWVGRSDWYWDGGLALPAWIGTSFFGEWLVDEVTYRMFKMPKLQKVVEAERAEGKKTV